MHIKSAFLSGFIQDGVFVKQHPSFEDTKHLTRYMCRDIIFGATNECLCKNFFDLMQSKFEMGMMGELKFFLILQLKQENKDIYIYQ
ncbi:hypothetical protein CR513_50702, partial [Mucuna pruriens]